MLSKSKLKYIQTLGQKKFRQQERCFVAEGPKIVEELLGTIPAQFLAVYALDEWLEGHPELPVDAECHRVTPEELEKISQLNTPNQVLALLRYFPEQEKVEASGQLLLALDQIQDPGNLGTIIRIADWFGIRQIVCSQDSADLYNPKVVQSTMGSLARVQVFYTNLAAWLTAQPGIRVFAAMLEGKAITSMEPLREGVILVGNESKGISAALSGLAHERITIPKKGNAESLNAAVATGIILSHLA